MPDPKFTAPKDARREGDPAGPSVHFDKASRRNFHLDYNGEPIFHGVPEGYTLDDDGAPVPIPGKPPDNAPERTVAAAEASLETAKAAMAQAEAVIGAATAEPVKSGS